MSNEQVIYLASQKSQTYNAKFLIWSWEHRGWWRPKSYGYTADWRDAGRYSWDQAAEIVIGHYPAGEEVAILETEVERNGGLVRTYA